MNHPAGTYISDEIHRIILSSISDAVFITDEDGALTFICPNVAVIFGYSFEEVEELGNISRLLGCKLATKADLDEQRELCNIEREIKDKSGKLHILLINVKKVDLPMGSILYTCRDITERKLAEELAQRRQEELAHASRVSTMGELASGIAHELSQPLSAIMNYARACENMIQTNSREKEAIVSHLAQVCDQSERAGAVLERLRKFLKKQHQGVQLADLLCVVHEAIELVRPQANREGISVRVVAEQGVAPLRMDVIGVQQVLVNLLVNAMEANHASNSEGSSVLVEIRCCGEQKYEVRVSDGGAGVNADVADRIFEPFFTSKEDGLGLGLSISRTIVESRGGQMWYEPSDQRGSTFCFTLFDSDRVA